MNAGLLKLNLSMNGLGCQGADSVSESLKVNKTLLEVDLSSNRISNMAVVALCEGLCETNFFHFKNNNEFPISVLVLTLILSM